MPLSKEHLQQIRDEALKFIHPNAEDLIRIFTKGYTAAVTAERERVKGLVTLDIYLTNGRVAKLLYPADITTVDGLLIQSRITDLLTNK